MRTFIMVVEASGISAAARRLSISKSVVSQRLSSLEDTLGTRLVQRSTRHIGLTDSGRSFYDRCVQIIEEVNEATDAVTEKQGELCGPLRLAAPMSFSALHLGPALYPFLKKHPRIDLKFELNDRMVDLVSEGYDMAVRIGRLPDSNLISRTLSVSRRVIVCSPEYADKNGLPKTLDELKNHLCISYANVSHFQQWTFDVAGKATTVKLKNRMQVNNGDVQRDAAIAGLGITILPSFLVSEPIAKTRLIVVPLNAEPAPDIIHAVYPQNRHLSTKVRILADHLRLSFGNPPYWDAAVFDRKQPPDSDGD